MPKISFKIIAIVAIAILASVVVYSISIPKEEKPTVRIAYNKLINSLPYFVALENGYFEEERIKVESIFQQDASLVTQSLLANKADVGLPVATVDLLLIEEKDPGKIKLFMGAAETKDNQLVALLVKSDSVYDSPNDLEGKKVATLPGTGGIVYPKMMFKKFFNPENVEYIRMIPTNWIAALEANQVDAIWSVEPIATVAINSGVARSILNSTNANSVHNPFIYIGFAFTTEFVEKEPETAEKVIKIMKKSVKFMEENPEETRRILAKYANLPEELIVAMDLSSIVTPYPEAKDVKNDIQVVADLMFELKFLEKPIDVGEIIYTK